MASNIIEIVVSAIDETSKAFGNINKSLKDIGTSMTKTGLMMTAGLTLPIIALGKNMVDSASTLEESMNAVKVVFKEAADEIYAFGETSAEAVGLSQSEFNQLSAELGAMLKNVGVPMDDLAQSTIDLTTRASDMASIFNTDVSQAFGAIQSAIKGEFNPLEAFGVKMNMAMITAKALEMGLVDQTGAVTDAGKAQAALAILYEQTDQFAGDFQNTSDGLANSTRITKAEFENMSAALGEQLLPIAGDLVKMLGDLIEKFNGLSEGTKTNVLIVAGLTAAIGPLLIVFGQIVKAIGIMQPLFTTITTATGGLTVGIIALIAGAGLLWAKFGYGISQTIPNLYSKLNEGRSIYDDIKLWFQQIADKFTQVWKQLITTAANIVNGVKNAFSIDWGAIGSNIIAGIRNGILGGLSSVISAAASVAGSALAAMKSALGINSPSTVFAGIGSNMMAGLEQGIEGGATMPINALYNVTNSITGAGAGAASGSGRGSVSVNLTYAPTFSMADEYELQNKLLPFIKRGLREANAS